MTEWIESKGPATIANLTCGFDIIGLALKDPWDRVYARKNDTGKINLLEIRGNTELSQDMEKNTAIIAVKEMVKKLGGGIGIDLILEKNLPLGSGLGSSAASAAAALKAVNQLLNKPFQDIELIPFALESEKSACGTAHGDNAAPAILGGLVVIRSYHPLDIYSIPVIPDWKIMIIHPQIKINTRDARKQIPREISLKEACQFAANFGGFIQATLTNNIQLLKKSMTDTIVEPLRAEKIPFYDQIKQIILKNKAVVCGVSGSGPSIYSIFTEEEFMYRAKKELIQAISNKIPIDIYQTKIYSEENK